MILASWFVAPGTMQRLNMRHFTAPSSVVDLSSGFDSACVFFARLVAGFSASLFPGIRFAVFGPLLATMLGHSIAIGAGSVFLRMKFAMGILIFFAALFTLTAQAVRRLTIGPKFTEGLIFTTPCTMLEALDKQNLSSFSFPVGDVRHRLTSIIDLMIRNYITEWRACQFDGTIAHNG